MAELRYPTPEDETDETEETEETEEVEEEIDGEEDEEYDDGEDGEKAVAKEPLLPRLRRAMPVILVYTRYLLPVLTVLTALVMSLCYAVKVAGSGKSYEVCVARLCVNTVTAARAYAVKGSAEELSGFYGFTTAGAVVAVLLFLLAAFLAVLAAITAIRAFRAGHESEQSNRMKVAFQIAFPNRVCYFLSQALVLVPLLYPEYFSFVGRQYLLSGAKNVIFVMLNRPLIAVGVLVLLNLILAVAVTRYERQKKMNMFLIWQPEDGADEREDEEEE